VGLKPILRNTTSFSALTLLVGSFDPQKPSPKCSRSHGENVPAEKVKLENQSQSRQPLAEKQS